MNFTNIYASSSNRTFDKGLMDYMNAIYKNMGIALLISALVAFFVANSPLLITLFFKNSIMRLLVALAPLGFSFYFAKNIWTSSAESGRNMLFVFAGLMGLSLSSIFLVYTKSSITTTFLTAAGMFGGMSLYGYRTKKDLTCLQSFLIMGVFGILIASLINMFARSNQMSFIISIVGVLVFTLYTAYDVQNLKKTYNYVGVNSGMVEKVAIIGSLQLYMDFINIFLYLLNFLGERKE